MNYKAYAYSAIGGRSINEDAVFIKEGPESVLAIVADGLGGHGQGEVASKAAVSCIIKELLSKPVTSVELNSAIESAHECILQLQNKYQIDMMSTVTVVWADDNTVKAAHVGDSRIYHIRGKEILYQSMDHSYVQLEVLMGKLNASEIRENSQRNLLIRALGYENSAKAEVETLDAQPNDRILLCSDGFWEEINEEEMLETSQKSHDAVEWLEQMKKIVLDRLSRLSDNHSAITIDII